MSYDPSALSLGFQLLGGKYNVWVYQSADAVGDVDATDYFSNASAAGMAEGDVVFVVETDQDPPSTTLCYVSEIDADGNGTVTAMAFAGAGSFTTLTASGATTLNGSVALGNAAADAIALYGTTPVTQRAGSIQSVTYATVASSTDFAAAQQGLLNSVALDVLEIKATLTALGAWKGAA